MIGVIDVEIQAANPQMPLYPMRAFVNSPSSVRVRNVPTEVGAWKITSVRVVVAYPDSSIKTADCVLAGSVWVATVAGCAVSGKTENGFTVFASGVDENGDAVSNYCLGKGAVEILQADGTLSPDAPSYYVHLFDEAPEAPNEGDMWPTADGFVIWQDGEAHALGGGHDSSKLDGAAAYPAWEGEHLYSQGDIITYKGRIFQAISETMGEPPEGAYLSLWNEVLLADLKQDALSAAQLANIAAVPGKANVADVNAALAQKASLTDLPYRLVEPGKWEFSDGQAHTITGPSESIGGYNYYADSLYASQEFDTEADALDALMLDFTAFTATRPSLPGHLLDRAVNAVSVTDTTTLTLPALVNVGKARDFLVKVTTSADDLNITWQGQGSEAPNGADELQFVTEDGDFPVVGTAGDYLFSFTEIEPHTFAVSMKTLVAAPQAQGGS